MSDQDPIFNMLNNLSQSMNGMAKDVNQLRIDLALNTQRTGSIEEHLKDLNGKVIKQEAKQQDTDTILNSLVKSKRRWDEGLFGMLRQFALFGMGLLSAFIIHKWF